MAVKDFVNEFSDVIIKKNFFFVFFYYVCSFSHQEFFLKGNNKQRKLNFKEV